MQKTLGILVAMQPDFDVLEVDGTTDDEKVVALLGKGGLHMTYETYVVAAGDFPPSVDACDAYFITGSMTSAFCDDPWVVQLRAFVREAYAAEKPLIGVCFGHQVINLALGGEVQHSSDGILLGTTRAVIHEQPAWMDDQMRVVDIYHMNSDQVTKLPPGARKIASARRCEHAVVEIPGRVLTFQGHPEQPMASVNHFIDMFSDRLPEQTIADARCSVLVAEPQAQRVAMWIKGFLEG